MSFSKCSNLEAKHVTHFKLAPVSISPEPASGWILKAKRRLEAENILHNSCRTDFFKFLSSV